MRGDYRPALDGVRAVAVLAVIAYHVTSKRPSGGFLGVDVFFVLSGYLITTLLLRAHARHGAIRLSEFWARRARRLFPAVLLLVIACAVVIASSTPILELLARRADMLSTLFYYANWHFIASDQSYFTTYLGASPLRHVWSLAIEEQFYVVWPLVVLFVMYLTRGRRRILFAVTVVGAAVSALRMASLYDAADPSRSYFGTDTRAHTLLIGSALAVLLLSRPSFLTHERARGAAMWMGPVVACTVLAAFVAMGEESYFYYHGGSVLFAVAVAVGLWAIETTPRGLPAAPLSWAPLRWIGRVSYGLYLWHWPLGVWLSAPSLGLDYRPRQAIEVASTFAAATASFYLVERPIRRGAVPWLRLSRLRLSAAMALAFALVGAFAAAATNSGSSLARQVAQISDSACPAGSPTAGSTNFSWCTRTAPATPASLVVVTVGDSTSRALDPGMRKLARTRGWRYVQAGFGGCSVLPLPFPATPSASALVFARKCVRYVPRVLSRVTASLDPDVWVISDRFPTLPLLQRGGRQLSEGDPGWRGAVQTAMHFTLKQMTAHGAQVVVVAVSPPGEPVDCATRNPPPSSCASDRYTTAALDERVLNDVYRGVSAEFAGKVSYISVDDVVCPSGRCPAVLGGLVVRYDGVHYTKPFSRKIVPLIVARAQRAGIVLTRR